MTLNKFRMRVAGWFILLALKISALFRPVPKDVSTGGDSTTTKSLRIRGRRFHLKADATLPGLDYLAGGSGGAVAKPPVALPASPDAHEHPENVPALRDRATQAYLRICKHSRASTPTPSKVTYSAEFQRALESLESHGITPAHATEARNSWSFLAQTHPLREPIIEITADGSVQFAWTRDRYYLEIEVFPGERFAWFFRDRVENKAAGTEGEPTSELPEAFWGLLTRENVAT